MTVTPADAQLRAAGLIPTFQRRAVLELLLQSSRPLTAQVAHAALQQGGRRIGLTTVYRALHHLAESGLLHTFDVDGERAYRHCSSAPHQHLICESCGQVLECPPEMVACWLALLQERTGFTPHADGLDLRGNCASCPTSASAAMPSLVEGLRAGWKRGGLR